MGAKIAVNFVATSASKASTTRARRSKLPTGQMKGDTRLTVRQAALLSLGSNAVADLIESEM